MPHSTGNNIYHQIQIVPALPLSTNQTIPILVLGAFICYHIWIITITAEPVWCIGYVTHCQLVVEDLIPDDNLLFFQQSAMIEVSQ